MMDSGDINCLKYFWLEKGDLERCASWTDMLPQLRIEHPEIVDAWERYKSAERTLTVLVKALDAND